MIVCEQLVRKFPSRQGEITALDGVSLTVERGDFAVFHGPSGCGKSTLLMVMGGMQRPGAGTIRVDGQSLYELSAGQRNRIRSSSIGFVFQLFHLIPYLTVRENILAGLPPSGVRSGAVQEADSLLEQLGLKARAESRPGTLSAGERQRTALARALIKKPSVILADEPTGNLDPQNAGEVFRHLNDYRKAGGTVVVVTHGQDASPYANRMFHMNAGRLVRPAESPQT